MTDTMLERMARAISDTGYIGDRAQAHPNDLEAAYEMARAALEAIREPSMEVALAGANPVNEHMRGEVKADYFAAKDCFTAMIDAILSEGQPNG